MNKFKFIELNKDLLPKTKGRRIDGHRFYEVDGKNYPSITTVLNIRKKDGLAEWRKNVGEGAANWEMGRAARRGKATHTLVEQYIKGETPSERSVLPIGLFKLLKPYVDQINNIHLLETTAYAMMYEEIFKTPIEQIVILLAAEDGSVACYKKEKKDYVDSLGKAIEDFYKYYEEKNKGKVSTK